MDMWQLVQKQEQEAVNAGSTQAAAVAKEKSTAQEDMRKSVPSESSAFTAKHTEQVAGHSGFTSTLDGQRMGHPMPPKTHKAGRL